MKAADVMVTNVITVGPNSTVEKVAEILLKNRISGVPVVGEQGQILGIVSEGDLMRRPEAGTLRQYSSWFELFMSNQALAKDYIKSHSHKVEDVMTREVISAEPETPLGDIATLLEKNRIKRVPIVKKGKLVGIVSRANLLQALASMAKPKKRPPAKVRDSDIREKVIRRLNAEPWRPSMLNVTVYEGTVDLWGMVNSEDEKKAARIAVEVVPGVRAINDYLMIPQPGSSMV